ncbi:hypothetical protein I79_005120 [Cricetulus griseus]|uniref:Uncharacterized protein n=1 Tax=Cricetulus griseus TaxID=10029 RepID=G3H4C0_CRIGR|nr:hypothetical protein I79_005120 [Cricetulus griseus]
MRRLGDPGSPLCRRSPRSARRGFIGLQGQRGSAPSLGGGGAPPPFLPGASWPAGVRAAGAGWGSSSVMLSSPGTFSHIQGQTGKSMEAPTGARTACRALVPGARRSRTLGFPFAGASGLRQERGRPSRSQRAYASLRSGTDFCPSSQSRWEAFGASK